jgi:hypothetical protein
MISFLIGFLALLNAFFRSRYSLAWRSLPSVSSCAYSSENILALGFEWKTEYSGFCSAVSGFPSPKTGDRLTDVKTQFHTTLRKANIENFCLHVPGIRLPVTSS